MHAVVTVILQQYIHAHTAHVWLHCIEHKCCQHADIQNLVGHTTHHNTVNHVMQIVRKSCIIHKLIMDKLHT